MDPFAVAVGVGVAGSTLGGPVLGYGLDALPQRWRRTAEWALVGGGAAFAVLFALLPDTMNARAAVYLLAALPGVVAYLAFRTILAPALVSLLPVYFVIGHMTRDWPTYRPEIALDRLMPLSPAWTIVYGSLYVFTSGMVLLVVRHPALLHRTMAALLAVMLGGYAGFLVYPTAAPRPAQVTGEGFTAWMLGAVYGMDPPHGCFPSLHVAYSFVAAFACYRVHRGVGVAAMIWASLIGISTVYTKQHYVVDVPAGVALALVAYLIFLRGHAPLRATDRDRQRAPARAWMVAAIYGIALGAFWVAYRLQT
jgi:membrane-associated phospholipid phosphatase